MDFKSGNWKLLRKMMSDTEMPVRVKVSYTHADLHMPVSRKILKDVDTTIVVVSEDDRRYVGIAQKGPNCDYKQEKGREIAAGRALHSLNENMFDDSVPDHLVNLGTTKISVFGMVPDHLMEAVERLL